LHTFLQKHFEPLLCAFFELDGYTRVGFAVMVGNNENGWNDGLLELEIGGALITSVDGELVGFVVVAGDGEGPTKGLRVGTGTKGAGETVLTWSVEGKNVTPGDIETDGAEGPAIGPSVGTGISDAGDIVGIWLLAGEVVTDEREGPAVGPSVGTGIDDAGEIVGVRALAGVVVALGTEGPAAGPSVGTGIDDAGDIVGI
jgi:hypothetical protein